jgi:hypothetical protein
MATRQPRMGVSGGQFSQLGHAEGHCYEPGLQLVSALGMALGITHRFWIGDRKVRRTEMAFVGNELRSAFRAF